MTDKLLNFAAWTALATIGVGFVMFFFDQQAAVGMEATGWCGIWVVGTLAERRALMDKDKLVEAPLVMVRCEVPGCRNLTSRGICSDCDRWADQQAAALRSHAQPK